MVAMAVLVVHYLSLPALFGVGVGVGESQKGSLRLLDIVLWRVGDTVTENAWVMV